MMSEGFMALAQLHAYLGIFATEQIGAPSPLKLPGSEI